jgi:hypothetical protein
MTITVYYGVNIYAYQVLYFSITCFYLKAKLKRLNQEIKQKCERRDDRNLVVTLTLIRSLDSIYKEIYEYNRKYWSKVSLVMIGMLCIVNILLFFVAIFGTMNWMLRILFYYLAMVFMSFFLFYIKTNSMITRKAFDGYKLLNNLYIKYSKNGTIPIRLRLKVITPIIYLIRSC